MLFFIMNSKLLMFAIAMATASALVLSETGASSGGGGGATCTNPQGKEVNCQGYIN
jgi:hypothetical protein